MDLYTYIVEHDMGFAPNPFFGTCSLAACKPIIRRRASVGDYIMGTGSAKRRRSGHLVFWMQVSEIITFDDYWRRPEFIQKRPLINGSLKRAFGDNIYFRDEGSAEYKQVHSFHSERDGSHHPGNHHDDVGTTDRIMLGERFSYFGGAGPRVPEELDRFVHKRRNHLRFADEEALPAIAWLTGLNDTGYRAEPTEWPFVRKFRQRR